MTGLVTYGLRAFGLKAAIVLGMLTGVPAQAQQTDILALGDSLTQGYGLIEQEGFVPQLRAWLAERGHDVRVVNAGVSGDTTAGGLSRVEWSLTPEIDAMIVALGGNDLLRGIDPAVARDNLDGILEVAAERDLDVLLIGLKAPGNYGAAYKRDFDAMYSELADQYDTVYLEDFFAGLRGPGGGMPDAGLYMQPDGIHPNATGVSRIVETVGPKVEELIERAETQTGVDGG